MRPAQRQGSSARAPAHAVTLTARVVAAGLAWAVGAALAGCDDAGSGAGGAAGGSPSLGGAGGAAGSGGTGPTSSTTTTGVAGGGGTAGGGGGGAPPGSWRVEGRTLRDPFGREAILHGVNMAGSHKSEGGNHYLGQDSPELYQLIHDEGYRVLRFLTTWAAVMPAEGAVDDEYLDLLEERLTWAAEAGLAVIVDMHQDIYGEGFTLPAWGGSTIGDGAPFWSCPNDHILSAEQSSWFLYYLDPAVAECFDHFWEDGTTQAFFAQAWAAVASRLVDHPEVIGIDPLNEPGWGSLIHQATYETERMVPCFANVIDTVRAIRPDLVAFVEPGARKNVFGTTTVTSLPFDNVVYAPHMYVPTMETGGHYDPAVHLGAFEDMLATDRAEADTLDAALLIGEWGSGISDDDNIALFMDDVSTLLDAQAASWTMWEAGPGGGYCLLESPDTLKPWASALRKPYPTRINGSDVTYSYDEPTRTLTVSFVGGPDVTLPTLVAAPTSLGAATLSSATNVAELVELAPGELALYAEQPDAAVSAIIDW